MADIHLAPRPGTDAALACAVMHIAFRDGYADRGYMARYTDCPDALEAHLQSRGPAWASEITGIPVEEIEAFGNLYGQTKRSFLRLQRLAASYGQADPAKKAVLQSGAASDPALSAFNGAIFC